MSEPMNRFGISGVSEVVVLLGTVPMRKRKFWQRVLHGGITDLEHAMLNGVSVLAVFDHQPSEANIKRCLEGAGASLWMMVPFPVSDATHAYLDKLGRERGAVPMTLDDA